MPLAAGTRLGHYEIVSAIGAGAMGEVYKARDTRLKRDVALKVLPETFAKESERLARFEREAEVLASLNHPHIAHIHGLEESGPALVMEFVDGDTLADRVRSGAVSVAEALSVARQIAEALEAAHAQGIVHRDLKPANIKIRPDGTVKLLDFGIAKALDAVGSRPSVNEPTATMTAEGIIVGTPAYMSPEQARGKVVDKRSDIWAFGCVLFEMLTARRVFDGETTSDTIVAILERDPAWDRLPAHLPPGIARMLRRALERDTRRRLHDIADARIEIEDALMKPLGDVVPVQSWRAGRLALIASIIAAVGATLSIVTIPRTASTPTEYRPVATEEAVELAPRWSPDGSSLVYIGDTNEQQEVFVRSLDSPVSSQLTTSCRDCSSAFWSSDGTRVFYTSAGDLFSITPAGGQPQRIIEKVLAAAQAGRGTAIAVLRATPANTTLWTAPEPNAALTQYTTSPFPSTFTRSTGIDFSPDGSKIAVLVEQQTGPTLSYDIWIAPYPRGKPYRVPLMAQWISPGTLSASGNRWATRRLGWAADNRHLVFQNTAPHQPGSHLYLVDTKTGATSAITTGTDEEWSPAVSPEGRRIAFTSGGNDLDLLQISFEGGVKNIVATSRSEYAPAWSPTAGRLAYVTTKHGGAELWVRNDSDGWSVPLLRSGAQDLPVWYALERLTFSPDGRKLAYGAILSGKHVIWVSPIEGGRPVPIDNESPDQHGPAWSPDGNWLSYKRLFNGQWEFVKAPLGGGPVVRLGPAPAGGSDTAWSPNGDWLAQLRGQTLELVSADGKSHRVLNQVATAGFAFAPDGALHVLRRAATRSWEVAAIDVRTGQERPPIPVPLPASATLTGFTLHPDGKSFVTARTTARFDIWLLDGFDTPRRFGFGFR